MLKIVSFINNIHNKLGQEDRFWGLESDYFCELWAHAKYQNHKRTLSWRKERIRRRERRRGHYVLEILPETSCSSSNDLIGGVMVYDTPLRHLSNCASALVLHLGDGISFDQAFVRKELIQKCLKLKLLGSFSDGFSSDSEVWMTDSQKVSEPLKSQYIIKL